MAQVSTRGHAGLRSPRRARALAVAGAVAAALAVWAVGEPLLGHDLAVQQKGQEPRDLGAAAIGVFALAPSLLGWALLAALERVTPLAARIWTAIALTLLAASFLPVIGVQASGGTKTVLALTHLAVGAVLIPVFWRTATSRSADPGSKR
ncbi:hypothetical protein BKA00_006463 [Actinomadura coerulea]|uniref:Uncharacterized protein n=1 Tax=Actinomadura coerulea TaxID=46159 RepID=A0A7X0G505_9ACTN|nr:DUF6069 family protein [Actinomadura coerulea]MBB6399549.1 hypothetical protein [Actinomadura coerulea]GGQ12933.1 hypothetical protein GCM10010187_31540 [Actinomadura coerulea]